MNNTTFCRNYASDPGSTKPTEPAEPSEPQGLFFIYLLIFLV